MPVSAMLSMIASLGTPFSMGPVVPLSLRMSRGPQTNAAVIEKTTITATKIKMPRTSQSTMSAGMPLFELLTGSGGTIGIGKSVPGRQSPVTPLLESSR